MENLRQELDNFLADVEAKVKADMSAKEACDFLKSVALDALLLEQRIEDGSNN